MDIYIAPERIFHLLPKFTPEIARDRVEQKKASLVGGTLSALLSRPKSDEIQLLSVENRLEPLWHIVATSAAGLGLAANQWSNTTPSTNLETM